MLSVGEPIGIEQFFKNIIILNMEETMREILKTQATLQSAVTELCRVSGNQERRPRDVLTKQTPDDDIETRDGN